jgi:hypothetical protein
VPDAVSAWLKADAVFAWLKADAVSAWLEDRVIRASGQQIQPARWNLEPAITGSMAHRAGVPARFRHRMVIPEGRLLRKRLQVKRCGGVPRSLASGGRRG